MLSPRVRQLHSPSSHADSLSQPHSSLFQFQHTMLPSASTTSSDATSIPSPPTRPGPDPSSVDFRTFYPYTPNEVKHRKRTSRAQLKVLEEHFRRDTKPNATIRKVLAEQLGMSVRGVQVWFQNRRAKEKALATKALSARKARALPQLGTQPSAATDPEHNHHHGQHHHDRSSHSPAVLDLIPESPVDSHSPQSSGTSTSSTGGNPSEFADTSSESSPIATHPPPLFPGSFGHTNSASISSADLCPTPWQNSPSAEDTVFIVHPGEPDPFESHNVGIRRGSLPVYYAQPADYPLLLTDDQDALGRRRSVDNSLVRLASHPYAHLARAKNGVVYSSAGRYSLPSAPPPPPPPPSTTSFHPQPAHHLGRAFSYGRSGLVPSLDLDVSFHQHQTPPLYDLSGPHHTSSSLPPHHPPPIITTTSFPSPQHHNHHLSRIVSAPLPGPLPSPNYSFGAAIAGASPSPQIPSPVDSDPADSIAFVFRNQRHAHAGHGRGLPHRQHKSGEDPDTEDDGTLASYGAYTRYGSTVSLAGSESSNASGYYSDVGSCIATCGSSTDIRRGSSSPGGGFLNLMSGLGVNASSTSLSEAHASINNAGSTSSNHELDMKQNGASNNDCNSDELSPSPSPTISPCRNPLGNDSGSTTSMSNTSALAFALQHQHHQHHHQVAQMSDSTSINVNDGSPAHAQQQQQHAVPFYYVSPEKSGAMYSPEETTSETSVSAAGMEAGPGSDMMDFTPDKFSFDGEMSVISANAQYHHHPHSGMTSTTEVYTTYGAVANAVTPATVNPSFLA